MKDVNIMENNCRLAHQLIRLARLLVAKNWTSEIQRKRPDLDADAVNGVLRGYSDPKEQKMVAYWLLDRKSINFPFDGGTAKLIDMAWGMLNNPLNRKLHLDFMKFEGPSDMVSFVNGQESAGNVRTTFNPDAEPAFFNKKSLGGGVTVYEVEDSMAGLTAIRKALDSTWGPNFNGWCLSTRKSNFGPRQIAEFNSMSDKEKEAMGFYSDDDLEVGWHHWQQYDQSPKRVAFRGGRIFAFSATEQKNLVLWWDKNNDEHEGIPGAGVEDDVEFLEKYGKYNLVSNKRYCEEHPEFIAGIINGNDGELKALVASNPDLSPDAIAEFAKDGDENVRWQAALNPNADPETLEAMFDGDSYEIRKQVIANGNFPVNRLIELAVSEDDNVRKSVAMNPNIPEQIMLLLAQDESGDVRKNVSINRSITPDVLSMLYNDSEEYARRKVADNERTPSGILAKMAYDDDEYVRSGVAFNRNTPLKALELLSGDESSMVRKSAAQNEGAPSWMLDRLAEDEDEFVRRCAMKNQNYRRRQ